MKKFVLFMMLMMCVASLSAQWSVTPEAGMNVTTYKNSTAKIGFKAGAAVAYSFGDGIFSLQSGLYYVQRGTGKSFSGEAYGTTIGEDGKPYDTSVNFYPGGSIGYGSGYGGYGYAPGYVYGYEYGTYIYGNYGYGGSVFPQDMTIEGMRTYQSDSRKDYLQLPVMARLNLKIGNDVRLHLAAGPYVAWGLGGKSDYKMVEIKNVHQYGITESSQNSFGEYSSLRRFDWGAMINAGIEVKRIAFNVGYDMGLGKQYKYDDVSLKYHTVSFTVGYTF